MRARGFYRIADCKELKATAIDLPYDVSLKTVIAPKFQKISSQLMDNLTQPYRKCCSEDANS